MDADGKVVLLGNSSVNGVGHRVSQLLHGVGVGALVVLVYSLHEELEPALEVLEPEGLAAMKQQVFVQPPL